MKHIIEFLDSIGVENDEIKASHNLSQDYNSLATATKEVSEIEEKIVQLKEQGNLVGMMNFEEHFNNYSDIITKINYLEQISETFIFESYKKILLYDSEKPFPEEIP